MVMDTDLKKALTEARAQVIWGHPHARIEQSLRDKGLTDSQIDVIMQTCMKELLAK